MQIPHDQIGSFLDAAPDAMVIVDSGGRIAFCNSQAEAMFEYSRAEIVGQSLDMLMPDRFRSRHADHILAYFVAPRRRPMGAELELFARRKDGTEFPVEISLSPVSTEAGTFVSSAIRDVTDRKAIEQKLVEARELAERANRAKSQFLAAASHDLRQPLQTLTLLSNVLGRLVPTGSTAATAVANQSEALRLMAELLNSLLDISKLEAGVIEPNITDCSVAEIFERLRAEFSALAESKGLDLIVEDCDDAVCSDPLLLGQIIQNLLANAIRYTRKGWVCLRGLVSVDTVRIEVADTGIGIPAEDLEIIFDEFYQRDKTAEEALDGVGLGLAIARRMATLLGCSLEVSSAVGRGSCFAVKVPRARVSRARGDRATPEPAQTFSEEALVLVLDDDEAVNDATMMLFGSADLDAMAATSTSEALEAIASRDRLPDLLICDYRLGPNENGVDAIRSIRERLRVDMPAILISGDTSSSIAEQARGLRDCHLLTKPVQADGLLTLAFRLLQAREP